MTRNNNNQEDLFDEYAYDWWNKTGNYKLLHKLCLLYTSDAADE